ncbi:hypothetical protein GCHA_3732 [Paraglaciecola chathamensis S18K6]|uniref:Uncharacterized protein n=1 Tax=Paraglaciecola chathamensis S18K6 TaxID=1127672 RepID=A0AAV3V4F2_9ALTE|nr:hypothetical protein GCHA_3732 [Paraglaciecola chathamensis S18K6]
MLRPLFYFIEAAFESRVEQENIKSESVLKLYLAIFFRACDQA